MLEIAMTTPFLTGNAEEILFNHVEQISCYLYKRVL